MKTYTAISIGPIIDTLSQVRKPRHLWSASYIFSHLMKIIIEQGTDLGGTLISPAKDTEKESGIGLYPDRAFFEGEVNIETLTDEVFKQLALDVKISKEELSNYFNLMGTSTTLIENSESKTIGELNKKLDVLELSNRCEDSVARKKVLDLILKDKESPLFRLGFGCENYDIPYLALIATRELECKYEAEWKVIKKSVDNDDETLFYKKLAEISVIESESHLNSYHKYFCVVQADGDSIGKVIANLKEDSLNKLSNSLIQFGKAATEKIRTFGGLPIYAGGDDLLFIAPVVSGPSNILNLINDIDTEYEKVISEADRLQKEKAEGKEKHKTTMSYGISISYYKYPLYEVLAGARDLLFVDAKAERNTIACRLRKHSGSSFKITLNKTDEDVKTQFEKLIDVDVKDNMVSAVAHKLRDTSVLWLSTQGDEKRLEAFFIKFMGLTEKELKEEKKGKELKEKSYLIVVKNMLKALIEKHERTIDARIAKELEKEIEELELKKKKTRKKIEDELNQNIYAMLRTAKFINGEELKDE